VNSRFLRFCLVGAAGFLVDAGLLQGLVTFADANPFVARIASFLAAATVTWRLNRRFTFAIGQAATGREWAGYVVAMTMGATVNYGAFAATLLLIPFARHQPWVGVAVGSVAGLAVNYLASSLIVFRNRVAISAGNGNGKSGGGR
jgi:putative flippase GtrA